MRSFSSLGAQGEGFSLGLTVRVVGLGLIALEDHGWVVAAVDIVIVLLW